MSKKTWRICINCFFWKDSRDIMDISNIPPENYLHGGSEICLLQTVETRNCSSLILWQYTCLRALLCRAQASSPLIVTPLSLLNQVWGNTCPVINLCQRARSFGQPEEKTLKASESWSFYQAVRCSPALHPEARGPLSQCWCSLLLFHLWKDLRPGGDTRRWLYLKEWRSE